MHFFSLRCVLHALPCSLSLVESLQYVAISTNYGAPHYAHFPVNLLLSHKTIWRNKNFPMSHHHWIHHSTLFFSCSGDSALFTVAFINKNMQGMKDITHKFYFTVKCASHAFIYILQIHRFVAQGWYPSSNLRII
jgi:hypothetical protein